MNLKIGYASIDENGNSSGGILGDQTGKEVKNASYYWFGQTKAFRFKDRVKAIEYANLIQKACLNDHIGYDQSNRTTFFTQLKKNNYDVEAINVNCACDCSSLVSACLVAVGINVASNMNTRTIDTVLSNSDEFEVIEDTNTLSSGNGLIAGDIVNKAGSHCISVLVQGNEGSLIDRSQTITSNAYLTKEEMYYNARYIYQQLTGYGWTPNAIAGVLGNMEEESTINAGIWQSLKENNLSGGFGLVQWTPATKLIEWCNENGLEYASIDSQLKRLEYERKTGIQYYKTSAYPITFHQFVSSTQTPEYLALAFVANYERPANSNQPERATKARYWYDLMISESWGSGDYEGGIETPDIGDVIEEGNVYLSIETTNYNMNQLNTIEKNRLKSLEFGDLVSLVYTYRRQKMTVGTNFFGKRLTFDTNLYTIIGIKRQGFLILRNNNRIIYINPKYVKGV